VLVLLGSTAILLTGRNFQLSLIGVQVSPKFVVFQIPPIAAPRYQVPGRFGSNVTAFTRPLTGDDPV
jgi:gamma-glutamylcysteine synthetase